jgi:hypothetical protein
MIQLKKNEITLLIVTLLIVSTLSIGHAYSNQLLLWSTLVLFMGTILASSKVNFLPLMLFYLPWSPVLKINPHSFTFFTLIVPLFVLLVILESVKKKSKYQIKYILLPLSFTVYTLFVKWMSGFPIDMSYLFFIMMLFFIPIYVSEYKDRISFERCVLFLTTGVLSACIASEILMNNPSMLQYIDVYKWDAIGLTRLSGFYGDPNFYSAQIIVAIAALLIVLRNTKKKPLIVLQVISIVALLFYGMQSVSKMFILCMAGIALIWIISLVIEKRNFSYKFGIISTLSIFIAISTASNLFSEQINNYILRFGMIADTQSLTTGRSALIEGYTNFLLSNIGRLYFGIGLSNEYLNDRSSHNTVIQIIYQVGVFGLVLVIAWWKMIYSVLSNKIKLGVVGGFYQLIIVIACFFPWLSLDMLYFDEFFYITIMTILARNYLWVNVREKVLSGEIRKGF